LLLVEPPGLLLVEPPWLLLVEPPGLLLVEPPGLLLPEPGGGAEAPYINLQLAAVCFNNFSHMSETAMFPKMFQKDMLLLLYGENTRHSF
jgi:hypothetical protein